MEEKWQRMLNRWLATAEGARFSAIRMTAPAESFARWVWPEKAAHEDRRKLGIGQTKWRMAWLVDCVRYLAQHDKGLITRRKIFAAIKASPRGAALPVATFDRMWSRARCGFLVEREFRTASGHSVNASVWSVDPKWLDDAGKVREDAIEHEDRRLRMERRGMSAERISQAIDAGDAIKPGRSPKFSVLQVVALVDGVALGANAWMRAAIQSHEMSPQTFWKLQKQARVAGLVRRLDDGRWTSSMTGTTTSLPSDIEIP